jgi:hypothetical protein
MGGRLKDAYSYWLCIFAHYIIQCFCYVHAHVASCYGLTFSFSSYFLQCAQVLFSKNESGTASHSHFMAQTAVSPDGVEFLGIRTKPAGDADSTFLILADRIGIWSDALHGPYSSSRLDLSSGSPKPIITNSDNSSDQLYHG